MKLLLDFVLIFFANGHNIKLRFRYFSMFFSFVSFVVCVIAFINLSLTLSLSLSPTWLP